MPKWSKPTDAVRNADLISKPADNPCKAINGTLTIKKQRHDSLQLQQVLVT